MACPICDKEADAKYRPFCSKRCADLDLGRWLNGSYAIPSDNPDDFEEVLEEMQKQGDPTPQKPH